MATGRTVVLVLVVLAASTLPASRAVTSPYVRPMPRTTLSVPDVADGQTPQQVRNMSMFFCSSIVLLLVEIFAELYARSRAYIVYLVKKAFRNV